MPERFLVAFSLAGEQRPLVRAVAESLEQRLGRSTVFFDEWYEHVIAGGDADVVLQEIYAEKCELAVMFISAEYGEKAWTNIEFSAIRQRRSFATSVTDKRRVMGLRVGDGDVPGILRGEITPDIRDRTPAATAKLIVDRLGLIVESFADGLPGGDWPDGVPDLFWPIANHHEARAAFVELLDSTSVHRVLRIVGGPGTGKSYLSEQLERNLFDYMPSIRCGRLDLKGVAARDIAVRAFAQGLGVRFPGELGIIGQLNAILDELQQSPAPSVVILDAYEAVGDARSWVEQLLLPAAARTRWLRVVVFGRQVPERQARLWHTLAGEPIELRFPNSEDWYEYGRMYGADEALTREHVEEVHSLSAGMPSVLAAILGPREAVA